MQKRDLAVSKKTKKCSVCEILKSNADIEKYFNTRLKSNVGIKDIVLEFSKMENLEVPSEYFLKQHKNNCLKSFVVQKEVAKTTTVAEKIACVSNVPKGFKDASLADKTLFFQDALLELLCSKLLAAKEDVTIEKSAVDVIKTLYDLAYRSHLDLSGFEFADDKLEVESTGLDLIRKIMSSNIQTESTTLDIVKLLLKNRKGDDGDDPADKKLQGIDLTFSESTASID
jgi:hypothetical protein